MIPDERYRESVTGVPSFPHYDTPGAFRVGEMEIAVVKGFNFLGIK